MASFVKILFYLSLFSLLAFHLLEARESQFFSRIPSVNSNRDDETLAEKIERLKDEPVYKPDHLQEPDFMPETKNEGFGLYGKSSEQIPSVVAAGDIDSKASAYNPYLPYVEKIKEKEYLPKKYMNKNYATDGNFRQGKKDNENYYNAEDFNPNTDIEEELNDFRFAQKGVNTIGGNINGNYYDSEDLKALDKQGKSYTDFLDNENNIYGNNVEKIDRHTYGNAGNAGHQSEQNKYSGQGKNSFKWDNNKAQYDDFNFEEGLP